MQRQKRFPQLWHAARAPRIASGGVLCARTRALVISLQPLYDLDPSGTTTGGSQVVFPQQSCRGTWLSHCYPRQHGLTWASAGHGQKEHTGPCKCLSLGLLPPGCTTLEKPSEAPPHSAQVPHAVGPREQMEKLSHGADKVILQRRHSEPQPGAVSLRASVRVRLGPGVGLPEPR